MMSDVGSGNVPEDQYLSVNQPDNQNNVSADGTENLGAGQPEEPRPSVDSQDESTQTDYADPDNDNTGNKPHSSIRRVAGALRSGFNTARDLRTLNRDVRNATRNPQTGKSAIPAVVPVPVFNANAFPESPTQLNSEVGLDISDQNPTTSEIESTADPTSDDLSGTRGVIARMKEDSEAIIRETDQRLKEATPFPEPPSWMRSEAGKKDGNLDITSATLVRSDLDSRIAPYSDVIPHSTQTIDPNQIRQATVGDFIKPFPTSEEDASTPPQTERLAQESAPTPSESTTDTELEHISDFTEQPETASSQPGNLWEQPSENASPTMTRETSTNEAEEVINGPALDNIDANNNNMDTPLTNSVNEQIIESATGLETQQETAEQLAKESAPTPESAPLGKESVIVTNSLENPLTGSGPYGEFAAGTDEGFNYKDYNEDAVVVATEPKGYLFAAAVIDGMSGEGGERAGQKAADALAHAFTEGFKDGSSDEDIQKAAHQEMVGKNLGSGGACYLGIRVTPNGMLYAWQQGDVRLVVFNKDGTVRFQTTDENYYEQIKANTPAFLDSADMVRQAKRVVTNALQGDKPRTITRSAPFQLNPGDRVAIATDGIWDNMESDQMANINRYNNRTPEQAVKIIHQAIEAAMKKGGKPDNRGIVIYEYNPTTEQATKEAGTETFQENTEKSPKAVVEQSTEQEQQEDVPVISAERMHEKNQEYQTRLATIQTEIDTLDEEIRLKQEEIAEKSGQVAPQTQEISIDIDPDLEDLLSKRSELVKEQDKIQEALDTSQGILSNLESPQKGKVEEAPYEGASSEKSPPPDDIPTTESNTTLEPPATGETPVSPEIQALQEQIQALNDTVHNLQESLAESNRRFTELARTVAATQDHIPQPEIGESPDISNSPDVGGSPTVEGSPEVGESPEANQVPEVTGTVATIEQGAEAAEEISDEDGIIEGTFRPINPEEDTDLTDTNEQDTPWWKSDRAKKLYAIATGVALGAAVVAGTTVNPLAVVMTAKGASLASKIGSKILTRRATKLADRGEDEKAARNLLWAKRLSNYAGGFFGGVAWGAGLMGLAEQFIFKNDIAFLEKATDSGYKTVTGEDLGHDMPKQTPGETLTDHGNTDIYGETPIDPGSADLYNRFFQSDHYQFPDNWKILENARGWHSTNIYLKGTEEGEAFRAMINYFKSRNLSPEMIEGILGQGQDIPLGFHDAVRNIMNGMSPESALNAAKVVIGGKEKMSFLEAISQGIRSLPSVTTL